MPETIILQNENLHLEFDAVKGTLIGLSSVKTGWKILDRPQLGLSFRLMLPLPGRRNNPVLGEKLIPTSISVDIKTRKITLFWDKMISEFGGTHNIQVTQTVTLSDHQVIFAMTIANHSELIVENVYCPYLGDVQHPAQAEWFKTFIYAYATANEWDLWPTYTNTRGYFGIDFPTQFQSGPFTGAPMSPFFLLRSADQGLYAGVASPENELVAWHTELRPGYGSSIDSKVPVQEVIAGKDVATRFAAVQIPYIQPGETRVLTPIALEAFQGSWQKGVDIYKDWRSSWMKPAEAPAWAREPHAWQQIHINSPEDELRIPFRDLPKVGEECARHGIKAIQLVGWNDGGQDQGNPSHDPDPRLGTFDELKEAIAKIQAMGVHIILFSKFTWADRATERFRKDLIRLAIKDPYGDYYYHPGYQYQTATQLLDVNTKRLIPMCFLSEVYLHVCEQEFQKTLDLGADGILFDECLHHGNALFCFDPNHGHRYGAMVYANDRKLIQNFAMMAEKNRPGFLFAGEACYDWEMEAYHLSYHRSENKEHIPLSRYMLNEGQFMTAVTGFNDRNMLNQCLMYRYIISYEPFNFKGHLDDYPLTIDYGKKVDALRTELRDYFWDGEFRHEQDASVTCEGQLYQPFSVFRSRSSRKTGIVVSNYNEIKTITVYLTVADGKIPMRYRLVDDPTWRPTNNGIVIPPCSAAVAID